jgi:cellobiose phosphorylase
MATVAKSYKDFGYFDPTAREFVITRPDTPRPWVNYLSNEDYCLILSQAGGGYSFYLDPTYYRVTRWEPANYLWDHPGRYLYIRNAESGEVWSGTYGPAKIGSAYECRHGMGYTSITNRHESIIAKTTIFVPVNDPAEVWLVEIRNRSRKPRNIQVFPFVEWLVGFWEPELGARNLAVLMNEGFFNERLNAIWAGRFPWGNKPWPYHAFMASSLPIKGYDVDLECFLGHGCDYAQPAAARNGRCTNSRVRGGNMVGVLQHDLHLAAGESAVFCVVVGLAVSEENAREIIERYLNGDAAERALKAVKRQWRGMADRLLIETPDADLNMFFNSWLKYQVAMNNYWGRSATYYHEGHGELGFRNTAQDAWGFLPLHASFSLERMILLAKHQRQSGQPMAGWSRVAGANEGKAPADFPIWLPLLVSGYVKETGDFRSLDLVIPYYDGGEDTLYRHVYKAVQFLQDRAKSERGLPLMGTQDWNDAFDRTGIGGRGESVWLGMGLCYALRLLRELAEFLHDENTVRECDERWRAMRDLINRYAWAGDRYIYAFNDKGEPIGSPDNDEGACQLNALTWAILAGIPNEEQLQKILHHLDTTLDTPFGPVLFAPPYTKYNPDIGRITAFAPGTKENAAVFIHGGTFKLAADLVLGRAEAAYRTLRQILPNSETKDITVYKTEPYIFPEYVIGPGNPRYGEGAFTWLTGSADWFLKMVAEEMLGVKPTFEGLMIEPCLPPQWDEVRVVRRFRSSRYDIRIRNPRHVARGACRITVDESPLRGAILPEFRDNSVHLVDVEMGE